MSLASLYMNNFISYDTVGSLIAPHDRQVLGMDSNVNELTTAGSGGAFDSNAKPFMDLGVAAPPNGDQLLSPGAQDDDDDDDIFGSLMGSQGPAGVVVDGNACLMAEMFPCDDQFEGDTPFPLEALLEEIEADMGNDADQDDQLQGGASGAGATTADVAGTTSLVGGESGGMMSVWDMGATATDDGLQELQAGMYDNADQDGQLQGGATGGATAADAAGTRTTSLISGEGGVMSDWDWDMGDFFMDSTGDFMFPHPHYMDSPE